MTIKKNAIDNNGDECTALVGKPHQMLGGSGEMVYICVRQDLSHWATQGIWDPLCVLYQTPGEGFCYCSDRDGLFVKEQTMNWYSDLL